MLNPYFTLVIQKSGMIAGQISTSFPLASPSLSSLITGISPSSLFLRMGEADSSCSLLPLFLGDLASVPWVSGQEGEPLVLFSNHYLYFKKDMQSINIKGLWKERIRTDKLEGYTLHKVVQLILANPDQQARWPGCLPNALSANSQAV